MVREMAGNGAARVLLGYCLKRLRERSGIHAEQAAAEAGVARATLWRMEIGDRRCRYKPGDVEVLGRLYRVDDEVLQILIELAKATRERTWVGAYRHLISGVDETFIGLEEYASRVRCYANVLVPDLLQTRQYAEEPVGASRSLCIPDVRALTQLRMDHQRVLTRKPQPGRFEFVVDESVLRRGLEPAVMAAQLEALADWARMPEVSLRVVPHRKGMYPTLQAGPFTIMEFPVERPFGGLPSSVYVSRLSQETLIDGPEDVRRYEQQWDDARANALEEDASVRMIGEILEPQPAA